MKCASLMAALFLAPLMLALPAAAHEGHDHADEAPPPAASGNTPRRLADGSVFLPKAAQRSLAVRTVAAAAAEHATALELNGRVIADPAASGVVSAASAGRVAPGPAGLPLPGTRVKRGQVLAWLHPVADALERGGAQAQLAELEAQLAVARSRAARLAQLEGSVPQKEIEAARIEADALARRRAALAGAVGGREALAAPVDGVVSAVKVRAGELVDARAVLIEIVDPARLMVEALAYDPALAARVDGGSLGAAHGGAPLAFVGLSPSLRDQAQPLLFRLQPGQGAALAVGQPVAVVARLSGRVAGVALPAQALAQGAAGPQVWVHTAAERFVPRAVTVQPLDGGRVLVTQGLDAGERVVVDGATDLANLR